MYEHELVELILSKEYEIFKLHEKILLQANIEIDDNQENINRVRIYSMLNIISENIAVKGKKLTLPNWDTCKRYDINSSLLDENFCFELDFFDCVESQRNCFEFVLNAINNIIFGNYPD